MIHEGGQGGGKNKETFSLSVLFWEIQKLPVLESSLEPTGMSLLASNSLEKKTEAAGPQYTGYTFCLLGTCLIVDSMPSIQIFYLGRKLKLKKVSQRMQLFQHSIVKSKCSLTQLCAVLVIIIPLQTIK